MNAGAVEAKIAVVRAVRKWGFRRDHENIAHVRAVDMVFSQMKRTINVSGVEPNKGKKVS